MIFRRRPPVGHRNSGVRGIPGISHHFAWCECGFAERTISEGAASGALAAHLRHAVPSVRTDTPPYVADDVEDHLAVAERALEGYRAANYQDGHSNHTLDAALDHVTTALVHYRIRLTQPDPPGR